MVQSKPSSQQSSLGGDYLERVKGQGSSRLVNSCVLAYARKVAGNQGLESTSRFSGCWELTEAVGMEPVIQTGHKVIRWAATHLQPAAPALHNLHGFCPEMLTRGVLQASKRICIVGIFFCPDQDLASSLLGTRDNLGSLESSFSTVQFYDDPTKDLSMLWDRYKSGQEVVCKNQVCAPSAQRCIGSAHSARTIAHRVHHGVWVVYHISAPPCTGCATVHWWCTNAPGTMWPTALDGLCSRKTLMPAHPSIPMPQGYQDPEPNLDLDDHDESV